MEHRFDRILLHGFKGVGKSTWASKTDTPLFANVEQGLSEIGPDRMAINRFRDDDKPFIEWPEGVEGISMQEFIHDFPVSTHRTAVIDTGDALNTIISTSLCEFNGWKDITSPGWQDGPKALAAEWDKYLAALLALYAKDVEIIILAHSEAKNHPNPLGADYVRYVPKISPKIVDKVGEWATAVLFAHYEETVKGDIKDIGKDRGKAVTSGRRITYTQYAPAHDAKNRYNLDPIIDLNYAAFDAGRKAFWAKKTGSPGKGAPPSVPSQDSTPGNTGTPAPIQATTGAPQGGGGSPVELTVQEVGQVLSETGKAHGITSTTEIKKLYMVPAGVTGMLSDATQGQLKEIIMLVMKSYGGKEHGPKLTAVVAKVAEENSI